MRQGLLITLGFVALTVLVTFVAKSRVRTISHEAFTKIDLADALSAAESSSPKGLVIADFSATWCGPCQAMLRETWSEPRVQAWVKSSGATAVLIDVDASPALAQQYEVQSIPLVIAFRGSTPVARLTGMKGPDGFLAWLEAAKAK